MGSFLNNIKTFVHSMAKSENEVSVMSTSNKGTLHLSSNVNLPPLHDILEKHLKVAYTHNKVVWSSLECAMLIDYLEQIEENKITRTETVSSLSQDLRNLAIQEGKSIDSVYRNENGITLQMQKMEWLLTGGHRGLAGVGKNFTEVYLLYSTRFEEFCELLGKRASGIFNQKYKQPQQDNPEPISSTLQDRESISSDFEKVPNEADNKDDDFCIIQRERDVAHKKIVGYKLYNHQEPVNCWSDLYVSMFIYLKQSYRKYKIYPGTIVIGQEIGKNKGRYAKLDNGEYLCVNYSAYDTIRRVMELLSCYRINSSNCTLYIQDKEGQTKAYLLEDNDCINDPDPFSSKELDSSCNRNPTQQNSKADSVAIEQNVNDHTHQITKENDVTHKKILGYELHGTFVQVSCWNEFYASLFARLNSHYEQIKEYPDSIVVGYEKGEKAGRYVKFANGLFLCVNYSAYSIVHRVMELLDCYGIRSKDCVVHIAEDNGVVKKYKLPDNLCVNSNPCTRIQDSENTSCEAWKRLEDTPLNELKKLFKLRLERQYHGFNDDYQSFRNYVYKNIFNINEDGIRYDSRHSSIEQRMRCLEYVIRTYARRNEKVKINTPQDIETAVDSAFKNFTNYTTILKDLYPSSLRKQLLGKVNESCQDTSLGNGKNIYDDKIRHVLSSEKYKNGFRYNSKLDMERFRAFYKNIIGEDCPNDLMPEHIANLGIVYDGMVYLPEAMLDSSACDKLEAYIEELFTSQNLISYKALFEHFQNNPGFQSIFNPEILKEYLKSTDAGKWKLCSDYLCPIDCSTDIRVEIKNAFANHPEPYSVDELCEQLPYLDKEKIVKTLRSQPCFLRDGRERYFLNTSFISDQNELSEIDVLLRKMLDNNEYVTTNELMDTLHRQHQRLFDNNSILSDIGIRNALSYHLRDFNFNGNLISYQGTDVNARRAFEQFALDHKEFTLAELKILATNFSSQINFDAIYKHALRVDETRFVSKETIDFDTIKTDKAISLFCKQDYISITAIDTFTSFPSIMYYPWTPFLLESYLHKYSKEYNILQSSFCETRVVGAIAKKTCHYQNFNDILVNVVATAACPLTPNEVLQYLCDEGFLARKKYADINKIITQATNQRNKKG